jgi:peptide chain release factor 3
MMVVNAHLGAPVRVARPYRLFGRERQTSAEACAGDVVGLVNPGRFAIGDSLYNGRPVCFPPIPRFPAEHFARLRLEGSRHKQFDEGVRQLEEEGLMQLLFARAGGRDPIVGVVGALQFDVIQSRLRTEYNVDSRVEPLSYCAARALPQGAPPALAGLERGVLETADRHGRTVLLFTTPWVLQYVERENPGVELLPEW